MRICILYDCLFPYTIGGAERWYANVASRLVAAGHEVTYLTMRQWPAGQPGELPGARVVAVGPRMANYGPGGGRTMAPPLLFGLGVFAHLLVHGRRYDVVHTASFPYFSLLAAAVARPLAGYRIIVDWHEFWSRDYWNGYLGALGWVGWTVQRLCLAAPQRAFCFARKTAVRLQAHRVNGPVEVLTGEYGGDLSPRTPGPADPLVVFAGRHIPEKRARLAVEAIALARRRIPDLRGVIFGRGPDSAAIDAQIASQGLGGFVEAPGFVEEAALDEAMSRALCLLHPSSREGYGMVVVEAAAVGTPTILVDGEDNAATELVEPGINGFIVAQPDAALLADAIVEAHRLGQGLRVSTADWFARNAERLSIGCSLARVEDSYTAL